MFKYSFYCVVLLLLLTFSSGAQQKNILVLHSYNSGLSWTDNINRGIFESFKKELHRTIDLRCEFMDSKHFENTEYFATYKSYLDYKYKNTKIDLVICSDNAAFNFLTSNHTSLFPDAPVVFCGVNYCDSVPKGFTGVLEDIDLEANLKTITTLHPKCTKIYVINDKSITGMSITRELNRIIKSKFSQLQFEYLTEYTLNELKQKLTTLEKNDVVLILLFNFDRLGNTYSFDVILDEISPFCKVPIYGTWDFYLGQGIVGGKIASSYQHGLIASSMAKELLAGKKVTEIPVTIGPTQYSFDYRILKKHKINLLSLPNKSEIIHSPFEFVQKNKLFFSLLGVILVLLVLLIIVLYLRVKKAKHSLYVEKKLVSTIELKSTELAIALEKAEQSNKLKAAFLSNISHEIRTPMNGILGFSELLGTSTNLEEQNNYIQTIHNCGNQLMDIINDIVEVSMIESQQIKANNSVISINQIIQDMSFAFSNLSNNNNTLLRTKATLPNDACEIITDGVKFKQILTNLIGNAFKFTENGVIEIGYVLKNNVLKFYVKDNGIGIDAKNYELIFERFRQVESDDLKKVYRGNGLGLSISKAYVELLGGKIWVESELGKGSIFYFTLPYVKAAKVDISSKQKVS